jgi:hypothetical protein
VLLFPALHASVEGEAQDTFHDAHEYPKHPKMSCALVSYAVFLFRFLVEPFDFCVRLG